MAAVQDEAGAVSTLDVIADELAGRTESWDALGLQIFRRRLAGRRGGIVHRSGRRAVLIDDSLPPVDAEFVIAHELAHLILSFGRVQVPREEEICDRFAERLCGPRPMALTSGRV